jgi:hypothetical protein
MEKTMVSFVFGHLLPNERAALIEALRRDARRERDQALLHPASSEYHLLNARMSIRILEAFGYREDRDYPTKF